MQRVTVSASAHPPTRPTRYTPWLIAFGVGALLVVAFTVVHGEALWLLLLTVAAGGVVGLLAAGGLGGLMAGESARRSRSGVRVVAALLRGRPPAVARRPYLVPRELPPAPLLFTGRAPELDEVDRHLAAAARGHGPRVVLLLGAPGIGKTALALRAAHALAASFPDGQLFGSVALRADLPDMPPGQDEDLLIHQVLGGFVRALQGPGDRVPLTAGERARRYAQLTEGRRVLVVLDDAASARAARSLLPAGRHCAAIVTSRGELSGIATGERVVRLHTLPDDDALQLLKQVAGRERVELELADAREIVRVTEGHPLSVRIAAASLAALPHAPLAHALRRMQDGRLRAVDGGDPYAGALDLGYAMLSGTEQRALQLLGLLEGGSFAPWALAALLSGDERADLDERSATRIAERLAHAGLLERRSEDSAGVPMFVIPEHVLRYARARLHDAVPPGAQAAARGRLAEQRDARERSQPARLLRGQVFVPLEQGRLAEALAAGRTAVALARDSGDRQTEALALAALADVRAELGSFEAAEDLANSALDPRAGEVSPLTVSRAHRCLAKLRRRLRQGTEAIAHLQLSLAAAREHGDIAEELLSLRELAVAQTLGERAAGAAGTIGEALRLCAAGGAEFDRYRPGTLWAYSVVLQAEHRLSDSERAGYEARAAAEAHGQRLLQAWAALRIARVRLDRGAPERCRQAAFEALEMFADMNHRYGKAQCRMLVGRAYLAQARYRDAGAVLEQAMENFLNCGDRWAEAEACRLLATPLVRQGDADQAVALLGTALKVFEDLGDAERLKRCRDDVSAIEAGTGRAAAPPTPGTGQHGTAGA